MLTFFLERVLQLGRKAREKARKTMEERIKKLPPPSHYMTHQPWHIPDPVPESLPWDKPRNG